MNRKRHVPCARLMDAQPGSTSHRFFAWPSCNGPRLAALALAGVLKRSAPTYYWPGSRIPRLRDPPTSL